MSRRAIATTAVEIPGPAGVIEGAFETVDGSERAVAVVCHPHPLHQGTMQNKVVTTLARAFAALGAVSLRFNFRGVGTSAGQHAGGAGEREDALAVLAYARRHWPDRPIYLAGFSFGAGIALSIAEQTAPKGLVTVAPAVQRLPADFAPPTCPWWLVHGEDDDVVPLQPVVEWIQTQRVSPHTVFMPRTGHFFHGRLLDLAAVVTDAFAPDFGSVNR